MQPPKWSKSTFPLVPATWITFIFAIGSSKSSIYRIRQCTPLSTSHKKWPNSQFFYLQVIKQQVKLIPHIASISPSASSDQRRQGLHCFFIGTQGRRFWRPFANFCKQEKTPQQKMNNHQQNQNFSMGLSTPEEKKEWGIPWSDMAIEVLSCEWNRKCLSEWKGDRRRVKSGRWGWDLKDRKKIEEFVVCGKRLQINSIYLFWFGQLEREVHALRYRRRMGSSSATYTFASTLWQSVSHSSGWSCIENLRLIFLVFLQHNFVPPNTKTIGFIYNFLFFIGECKIYIF